jgi:hypothetical protein
MIEFSAKGHEFPRLIAHAWGMGTIYRGHADSAYRLIPDVFRTVPPSGIVWENFERDLLDVFRLNATGVLDRLPDSEIGWMILARHSGVPTRLLDWSIKPLVALWFAVSDHPDRDGAVFRLSASNGVSRSKEFDPFVPTPIDGFGPGEAISALVPPSLSPRVTAQGSVLTVHDAPEIRMPFVPLEDRELREVTELAKALVPQSAKATILNELHNLGVNSFSVYPDLFGLGRWVRDLAEDWTSRG